MAGQMFVIVLTAVFYASVVPTIGLKTVMQHTNQDCECGEHGACLVDECYCHPGWEGATCQASKTSTSQQSACRDEIPVDDLCMNMDNGWGRLLTFSKRRHEAAAECETRFWEHHRTPMRNEAQVTEFKGFGMLPNELGNILEIGAGPYTKTKLILEEGLNVHSVKSITLEDPMLLDYIKNLKVHTSFNETTFCWTHKWEANAGGCVPVTLLNVGAEEPFKAEAYDTIIMMNVIEHCSDAFAIFSNLYHALKPGGVLVFSDSVGDKDTISKESDTCHPIQVNLEFYDHYFKKYFIERGAEVLLKGFTSKQFSSYVTVIRKGK
jgi:SAM-dependent methyltransferase